MAAYNNSVYSTDQIQNLINIIKELNDHRTTFFLESMFEEVDPEIIQQKLVKLARTNPEKQLTLFTKLWKLIQSIKPDMEPYPSPQEKYTIVVGTKEIEVIEEITAYIDKYPYYKTELGQTFQLAFEKFVKSKESELQNLQNKINDLSLEVGDVEMRKEIVDAMDADTRLAFHSQKIPHISHKPGNIARSAIIYNYENKLRDRAQNYVNKLKGVVKKYS